MQLIERITMRSTMQDDSLGIHYSCQNAKDRNMVSVVTVPAETDSAEEEHSVRASNVLPSQASAAAESAAAAQAESSSAEQKRRGGKACPPSS